MSDNSANGFGAFVPGFDFLQGLVQSAARGGAAAPAASPDWSKWVAPTMQAEEIDKRIGELKTVQFWLEQNARALSATIQALEVQKMTLATLRTMNVQVSDLASAFGFGGNATQATQTTPPASGAAAPAFSTDRAAGAPGPYDDMFTHRAAAAAAAEPPAPPPEPEPAPVAAPVPPPGAEAPAAASGAAAPAAVDPLQWWNALAGQFQQIAAGAMQDAAEHARTSGGAGLQDAARQAFDTAGRMAAQVAAAATPVKATAKAPAAKKTPAKKAAPAPAAPKPAAKKVAAKKTAVKQPVAKKAAARKTTARKPDPRNAPASPVTWRRVR